MKILLVGHGKMGGILARRWQEQKLCRELGIVDPLAAVLLSESSHVWNPGNIDPDFRPDAIVFAVKPHILGDIVNDYKKYADQGSLTLSIAAGKSTSFYERHFGSNASIVRAMPNTPASIGQGISVAYANKNVSEKHRGFAEKLLGAIGEVVWIDDETLLNPVTALSGSGPAYVFLLVETLTAAGIKIGLEPALAEKLARQTVIGSAALIKTDPKTPVSKLRTDVTSPSGTTQAALDVLMASPGIQSLFDKALTSATRRAEELSGELGTEKKKKGLF